MDCIKIFPSENFQPDKIVCFDSNRIVIDHKGEDNRCEEHQIQLPQQHQAQYEQQQAQLDHPYCGMKKFFRQEICSCLIISLIVIGLPIAIMLMLINLPRLSNHRDVRQQNYILLAFGLPFSIVISVSTVYGLFRLIRKFRSENNLHQTGDSNNRYENSFEFDQNFDDVGENANEPRLYTLVTEIMSKKPPSLSLHHSFSD
ncbi:hypothetical protein SSS_06464 [Sarcoptes scabiei]|uniref:Uncharacterized protein n=1 Tax=Sarcoptes scabiei TaxID=52283 RepID=A0A834VAG2_SARSC|nr:hypothetical protein SSS_06464 [Sarcoptes scabiei]